MQKIVPSLWFDHNAVEAAEFYTSVFPDARVLKIEHYPTEGLLDFQQEFAGNPLSVNFELCGYRFDGINAGPEFPINPSLSFMVTLGRGGDQDSVARVDALWAALVEGGRVLIPLAAQDWGPYYGWVEDRFGVSWQLGLDDAEGDASPPIVPCLLFGASVQNRGGEALEFYREVFPGARVGTLATYPEASGPAVEGAVMYGDLELFGQRLAIMDAGVEQETTFTCGVSLILNCADDAELDRYWSLLSAVPEAEQCGWCADRFGVSWQVLPDDLEALLSAPGAFEKMMSMKKIVRSEFL